MNDARDDRPDGSAAPWRPGRRAAGALLRRVLLAATAAAVAGCGTIVTTPTTQQQQDQYLGNYCEMNPEDLERCSKVPGSF
jgi:hypothetical protein